MRTFWCGPVGESSSLISPSSLSLSSAFDVSFGCDGGMFCAGAGGVDSGCEIDDSDIGVDVVSSAGVACLVAIAFLDLRTAALKASRSGLVDICV